MLLSDFAARQDCLRSGLRAWGKPSVLDRKMWRHLHRLALPLVLAIAACAPRAYAGSETAAASNGGAATPGPVFSLTGPDAAAYGAPGFPLGTRATASQT